MRATTTLRCVLLLGLAGCGYRFAGTPSTVPPTAQTITVELFNNRSHEDGIEVHLRRAIEDEFRRRGPLTVVPQNGDLVLTGVIRRFTSLPVTFIGRDQAVLYQGTMQIAFSLKERGGKVLYATKSLSESQDFGAVSNAIVTSSPHFQEGTIDARDLPLLTNVQINETRRRTALVDLLDVLARDVYLQAMEGF